MIRLTRTVFGDLVLGTITFGILVGVAFPFLVAYIGVPKNEVYTLPFFASSICVGIIIGGVSFFLTRGIVGKRVQMLADRMRLVEGKLAGFSRTSDIMRDDPAEYFVPVDSEDEIGESAEAFNHLVAALSTSLRNESAVRNFTEMLACHLDLDALTMHALQQLIRHTRADAGAILVEASGELTVAAFHGLSTPQAIAANERVGYAMRTSERQRINLPEDLELDGVIADFRPREVLIEPVSYKQIPLGAIVLASTHGFSDQVMNNLDLLRNGLALALNNAIVHDRLQRLAAIDPLTGVYNRRFGMARYHEEFGRAVRSGTPLGVMIFDIDHFKEVNDTYGHLAGDRVLARVTRAARTAMREGDVIVRYGGEEFLVILPAAAKSDVERLAERVRRLIEDTAVTDGDQIIRVTVSVGGTAYPAADISDETVLLQRADEALYAAKQSGRNRFAVV